MLQIDMPKGSKENINLNEKLIYEVKYHYYKHFYS